MLTKTPSLKRFLIGSVSNLGISLFLLAILLFGFRLSFTHALMGAILGGAIVSATVITIFFGGEQAE